MVHLKKICTKIRIYTCIEIWLLTYPALHCNKKNGTPWIICLRIKMWINIKLERTYEKKTAESITDLLLNNEFWYVKTFTQWCK